MLPFVAFNCYLLMTFHFYVDSFVGDCTPKLSTLAQLFNIVTSLSILFLLKYTVMYSGIILLITGVGWGKSVSKYLHTLLRNRI